MTSIKLIRSFNHSLDKNSFFLNAFNFSTNDFMVPYNWKKQYKNNLLESVESFYD